jgi:hypothetical protein
MSYLLEGRIAGRATPHVLEPLAGATIKLYRHGSHEPLGFALRDEEESRGGEGALLGQTRVEPDGSFRIDLAERSVFGRGAVEGYDGGALRLDVYCRALPGAPETENAVQFTVASVQPRWSEGTGAKSASWSHEIPTAEWSQVREGLDLWMVAGRVVDSGGEPLDGVRVSVFDADVVDDDLLGTADTDRDGHFRVDYAGSAFRDTPVGVDFEQGGRPDIYFRVETPDGTVLLDEGKRRADDADRKDVGPCVHFELSVDPRAAGRS